MTRRQLWGYPLQNTGWYHDEPNSGPGYEIWKFAHSPGGEIKIDGGQVTYMEGRVETLQRAACALDMVIPPTLKVASQKWVYIFCDELDEARRTQAHG